MDDFFTSLETILLPVSVKSFEWLAVRVTKFIAHEYGAKVILLHIGENSNSQLLKEFEKEFEDVKVRVSVEVTPVKSHSSVPKMILERYLNGSFQLIVIPSRRRSKLIDKFLWNSVSEKIIPYVAVDVLQVYAAKKLPEIIKLKDIACLVPYSDRDPYLLRWAAAIVTSKVDANLIVYHVDEYPAITPREIVANDPQYLKHKAEFEQKMRIYSVKYACDMKITTVLCNKLGACLEDVLSKKTPDLLIMGASKQKRMVNFSRNMSEKIIDKIKCGAVIHHWKPRPKHSHLQKNPEMISNDDSSHSEKSLTVEKTH